MRTEQESREETGLITDTLAFLANFGCRHPWIVVALTLLTCTASLLTSFYLLKFHTQRNDLISPGKDYYQRWKQYVDEFGDDDDMVMVVEGSNHERMIAALEDVAGEVAKQPELYDRLFYKVDLRHLQNRQMLLAPSQKFAKVQADLDDFRLLLAPPGLDFLDKQAGFKLMGLQVVMTHAQIRAGILSQNAASDDDKLLKQLSVICRGAGDYLHDPTPSAYRDPWREISSDDSDQANYLRNIHYFFSKDGKLGTLLVRAKKTDMNDFTFAQKSIDGMRGILAGVKARFPDLQFGLTGLPVLENDEMNASQNDSNLASWLALIGVAVLYLVVYRGFRYPLMTVVALLVGTAWALGWTTLTVGHLNILSSAFAVMLIGMGDYGVLWVTKFGQERQRGATLQEAISITAVSVGPGILTAALTTALAFFATMLADLKAVAELGWIAGCGVLLCALSCFIVMPALLSLFDARMKRKQSYPDSEFLSLAEARMASKQWLPGLTHRPRWVIPVSLAVTVVLAYVAFYGKYDHNLLHMQAKEMESVQWEHKLIQGDPGTSWHALNYTNTPGEALALKAKFEKLPEVSEVRTVADLVPADQERRLVQLRDVQDRLKNLPRRGEIINHKEPNMMAVVVSVRSLYASLESLDGNQARQLRQNLLYFLSRIEEAGDRAGPVLKKYEELMTASLVSDLHYLRDISMPAPITVDDLPPSLRERFIGKNGKWLLRIFAKKDLWEYPDLEKFVAGVQKVDPEATGKPFTTLEGLRAMKDGFFWAGIYAFIAMVIVLLLDFGNYKHTILALAPLLMGLVATLGLMVLFGISLNPANMIAFPLVLGVGADNGVHVLHDYRTRQRDRRYSLSFSTGWGIMVAALTTILGFCTLMISQHRGLYSLGLVLTLGVTCCMLTALVFLPALLRSVSLRGDPKAQAVQDARKRQSA